LYYFTQLMSAFAFTSSGLKLKTCVSHPRGLSHSSTAALEA
jgi:hypothetical protein